jgi:very-short-patch-repair endonuclease
MGLPDPFAVGHRTRVNAALASLLRAEGGVVTRSAALAVVPRHVLAHAVQAGHVTAVYAGVLVARRLAATRMGRWRAALLRTGPDAALSHVSALEVWGLRVPRTSEVHVTTAPDRRIRVAGIVAHRRVDFAVEPPQVVIRQDLAVTNLELSLVESWPQLAGDGQRGPLLDAVGRRWTTAGRVLAMLPVASSRLPGRDALRTVLKKIAAGCRSELELWGYDHVFNGPEVPAMQRQVPVRIDGRTIYLDLLHRPTATNFELDGTKWHDGTSQRERDLRRDAELAKLGIQTIRFSHDRLTLEPEMVRRDVLAILARREAMIKGQFGRPFRRQQ